jgi:hypothetical protein
MRVEGEITVYSNTGGRFLDYRAETAGSLDYGKDYTNYIDKLEYDPETDVFQSENAIFIRTTYPGSLPFNDDPLPAVLGGESGLPGPAAGGRPVWVDNPPDFISGCPAGVGYAGRRDAHRDTVIASYENAVFAILRDYRSSAWSNTEDFRGGGFLDYAAINQKGIKAGGVLTGFYVLDMWVDPVTKAVWTLALAQVS